MVPNDFIALLKDYAQQAQAATGVPASFTIAQAAVESAWGESKLSKEAFNYFGIKAIGGWTGDTITFQTGENMPVTGQHYTIVAPFRKYANLEAGLEDHARFLLDNPRYGIALTHEDDSCAFAMAVAAAGYATGPGYGQKICDIINYHNLKNLDHPEPAVAAQPDFYVPPVETPTEPVAETPTEPVVETPTEPVVETPTEPVVETPTEKSAEEAPAAPFQEGSNGA